jgi:hypothetical protein
VPDNSTRHRFYGPGDDCYYRSSASGKVMVPWNKPAVKPVPKSTKRSSLKLPWAPVNRPVPPVMA